MKTDCRILLAIAALACSRLPAQVPVGTGTLINSSALVTLAPGGTATLGFFVGAQTPQPALTALIRAVGPSLSIFGIKNPAALPHLRLFNGKGQDVTPAAQEGGWSGIFASVGAFPLNGGERPIYSYTTAAVSAGGYTVQVSDDSGNGGTVLIEVYLINGFLLVPGSGET